MSARPRPAAQAAELAAESLWAAFIERQHRALGGDEAACAAVVAVARAVWRAAGSGDSCVPLDELAGVAGQADGAVLADALRASPAFGDDQRLAPLVLDAGNVYLHRLWSAECRLARRAAELDRHDPVAEDDAIAATLQQLRAGGHVDEVQRSAIALALTRRLALISGGPGTGKTTTLAALLVAFARLRPGARIAITAPTGRAAARLAESLAQRVAQLGADPALRAALPASGLTLHRLLGARGPGERFAFGAGRPLVEDLVVVDEASMIDLELARRLAEAIPAGGRLVLAGDSGQLASVEAGSVFAELVDASAGSAIVLEHNYRQDEASGIAALAARVRAGSLAGQRPSAIAQRAPDGPDAVVAEALAQYAAAIAMLSDPDTAHFDGDGAQSARALLAELARYRLLTALREGAMGARGLAARIAAELRRRLGVARDPLWYPGRFVMATRNAPGLGLANGDTGICLRAASGLRVAFATGAGLVQLPVALAPECEDAWAVTVHKAQGSEFDAVGLVLAPVGHRLNTRELVYTGVTRARRRLTIWADEACLEAAVANPTRRRGRLAQRVRELAGGPVPAD